MLESGVLEGGVFEGGVELWIVLYFLYLLCFDGDVCVV